MKTILIAIALLAALIATKTCAAPAAAIDWNHTEMVIVDLGAKGQATCFGWVAYPDFQKDGQPFWRIERINGVKYFCSFESREQVRKDEEIEREFQRAADLYMGRVRRPAASKELVK